MSQFAYPQASPAFSGGGADISGTPGSRIVTFSPAAHATHSPAALLHTPDHGHSGSKLLVFSSAHNSGGGFRTSGLTSDDPFVTPSSHGNVVEDHRRVSAPVSSFRQIYGNGLPEESDVHHPRSAVEETDKAGPSRNPDQIAPVLSTELMLSRCIEVSCLTQVVSAADIEAYQAKLASLGSPSQGSKEVFVKNNKAYIRFTNIRDACVMHRNVHLCGNNWIANFIPPSDFAQSFGPNETYGTHDGQLDMLAVLLHNAPIDVSQVESLVFKLLQSEGDLFAFQKDTRYEEGTVKAFIEYADVNVAINVAGKLNGIMVDGLHMRLDFYPPTAHTGRAVHQKDIVTPMATPMRFPSGEASGLQTQSTVPYPRTSSAASNSTTAVSGSGRRQPTPPSAGMGGTQMALVPMMLRNPYTPGSPMIFDPYGPHGHTMTAMGSPYVFPPHGLVPAGMEGGHRSMTMINRFGRRGPMRSERYPSGHHNQVDVNRIRNGVDVRTTIMLRNIPNKVDQRMLKAIIDESSWGKYDFMYLRIDFANDCNVGYAFINFSDPLDIVEFANAKDNQRWNCFRSDKVAEISYATIQGRDCLVQKFRNSSVMLEPPHYRPKLFYTLTGPHPDRAGKEEPFPIPDNPSKMKRSCENAEHVGLFTPHLSQYYRDEQRRRRSQFDRGTTMAAAEEFDLNVTSKRNMYINH